MIEALGIVFGGASRLVQHHMESKDKQKEREHEQVMMGQQIKLNEQKFAAEAELRKMDITATADLGDLNALTTAIQAQSSEAKAAGGWAASLSATVRPVLTYFLLLLYATAKIASFIVVDSVGDLSLSQIVGITYTEFDSALLGSVVYFWLADRSLRMIGK